MQKMIKHGNEKWYSVDEFVVDTLTNLSELPVDCETGSMAYCFEDKNYYILNFEKEWVKA